MPFTVEGNEMSTNTSSLSFYDALSPLESDPSVATDDRSLSDLLAKRHVATSRTASIVGGFDEEGGEEGGGSGVWEFYLFTPEEFEAYFEIMFYGDPAWDCTPIYDGADVVLWYCMVEL